MKGKCYKCLKAQGIWQMLLVLQKTLNAKNVTQLATPGQAPVTDDQDNSSSSQNSNRGGGSGHKEIQAQRDPGTKRSRHEEIQVITPS